jgi:hypothetical protein
MKPILTHTRFLPALSSLGTALLLLSPLVGSVRCWSQGSLSFDVNSDGTSDLVDIYHFLPNVPGGSAEVRPAIEVYPDNTLLSLPDSVNGVPLGTVVDASLPPVSGAFNVGIYGIRFRAADGVHFGWVETYNPILAGRPAFSFGCAVKQFGYNPVPNVPFTAGTPTPIVVQATLNPATGSLLLKWSVDASKSPAGLRVESRSLSGPGNWSLERTVFSGRELVVPLAGDGRLFRVVQ